MSYTNGTTHYNLPLTTGTDKRDWADTNQAFSDVDAALYGAVQDTAQAALDIDALEGRMDTAEQNISTNAGNISGLDTRLTTAEGAITTQAGQISDTRQDLEDMICAYNEASATSTHAYAIGDYFIYNDVLYRATASIAIGDTIVPDTNCETTNVTTEIDRSRVKTLATVTTDGVVSYQTLFETLMAGIIVDNSLKYYLTRYEPSNRITRKYNLEYANESGNQLVFSYVEIGSTNTILVSISMSALAGSFRTTAINNTSGTVTYTEDTTSIATSGYTWTLSCEK